MRDSGQSAIIYSDLVIILHKLDFFCCEMVGAQHFFLTLARPKLYMSHEQITIIDGNVPIDR